jgi:hypothetical protein
MTLARQRLQQAGAGDIQWLEFGLRELLQTLGVQVLSQLLNDPALPVPADHPGLGEKVYEQQRRTLQTLFGKVELRRRYYHDPARGQGRHPLDEALGLIQGVTPALARLMARSAAREPYETASQDLAAYTGVQIEGRQFPRLVQQIGPRIAAALQQPSPTPIAAVPRMYVSADGTGIPLRRDRLRGRRGRQPDGSAKTHEIKIGCVFTQHPRPGEDPFRDLNATSYVATPERTGSFGPLLLAEARRRGMGQAGEVIFLSDGAAWLKEIARVHFPQALYILDFYHAAEHLAAVVKTLYPPDSRQAKRQLRQWTRWLLRDGVDRVLNHARALAPPVQRPQLDKLLHYFEVNRQHMRYGTFQQKGYFIGSGVVEAGCKSVIGKRLKQGGMFWSEEGADDVLTLRCALYSQRYDEVWNALAEQPDLPAAVNW